MFKNDSTSYILDSKQVEFSYFVDAYKQSIGEEGAKKFVIKVASNLPFGVKESYSKEQALLLCQELQKEIAYLGMIGTILYSRLKSEEEV